MDHIVDIIVKTVNFTGALSLNPWQLFENLLNTVDIQNGLLYYRNPSWLNKYYIEKLIRIVWWNKVFYGNGRKNVPEFEDTLGSRFRFYGWLYLSCELSESKNTRKL